VGNLIQLPQPWSMEAKRASKILKYEKEWLRVNSHLSQIKDNQLTSWDMTKVTGEWAMQDWVINEQAMRQTVGLFVGDSNVGKTYLLCDLAWSVVTGKKWLGCHDVTRGPVMYMTGESTEAFIDRRIIAINKGRGKTPEWFLEQGSPYLNTMVINQGEWTSPLSDPRWWERTMAYLRQCPEGARPPLWIFDPLMALADNPDDDAKVIMKRLKALAVESDAFVILAHHPRKRNASAKGQDRQGDRIHGVSAWRNLADEIFFIEANDEDPSLLHCYKNKSRDSGPAGEHLPSFHVKRSFSKISRSDFLLLLRGYNVQMPFEEFSHESFSVVEQRGWLYTPKEAKQPIDVAIDSNVVSIAREEGEKGLRDPEPTEKTTTSDRLTNSITNEELYNHLLDILNEAPEGLSIRKIYLALQERGGGASKKRTQLALHELAQEGQVSYSKSGRALVFSIA